MRTFLLISFMLYSFSSHAAMLSNFGKTTFDTLVYVDGDNGLEVKRLGSLHLNEKIFVANFSKNNVSQSRKLNNKKLIISYSVDSLDSLTSVEIGKVNFSQSVLVE
jgi:hypothetical protein